MPLCFQMLSECPLILIASKCSRPVREVHDVFPGTACGSLPCGNILLHIWDLEAILLHIIWHIFSHLRQHQIIRWFGGMVAMSKLLAFMPKFNNVHAFIWPTHNFKVCFLQQYTITLRLYSTFCIAWVTPWHLPCYPHQSWAITQ